MAHPDSVYRIGEPLPGNWDMAFELRTDVRTANLDYGDAPIVIGGTRSHPNYPNPFNPETTITCGIDEPGQVRLLIFNLRGRRITELVDRRRWRADIRYGGTAGTVRDGRSQAVFTSWFLNPHIAGELGSCCLPGRVVCR